MSKSPPYELVAEHEDDLNREELRRYPDAWEAVRMRARVGGGWYVRDSIHIPAPYVTKAGKVLTDADIQALADEAERGYDVARLSPALIETIAEAYHLARCSQPDGCPADCPHRMPADLAVAVHRAVVARVTLLP